MFISSFPYSKINHSVKLIGSDKYVEHVYSFRGKSRKRYLVIVEEYDFHVFVVKFCLQERKIYSDRFTQLSNLNECSKVLTTVGYIMRDVQKKNPFASFGFLGSPLPEESKTNTKRFKLYSKVVSQLISPIIFEHHISLKHSGYLLINRDNEEPELLDKIIEMFDRLYLLTAP